ncbi:MAG: type II toxin-antitoxin system RelE/ParE family toxin [Bacteroidales bacterium]|nr:type II toxin-antitoxin system RelE/ParE family toxin [Bacteroidales bacterium]
MAKRKIIWSHRAEIKLFKILEFYAERNKSKIYSAKLYQRLNKELKVLLKHPDIGLNTEIESVRGLIVDDYILFYEFDNEIITVHSIWDCRQNHEDLRIK